MSVQYFAGASDTYQHILEIQKAFEAGHAYNIPDMTDSQAGRIESLESSFKVHTHKLEDAALWRLLSKKRISSTVHEHATLDEVPGNIFYDEGGDVSDQDAKRTRHYSLVKYMGVKATVTFPSLYTRFITPAESQAYDAAMKGLIRGIDLALYFGNETLNSKEFDGLIELVLKKSDYPTQQVIDLRGQRLTDTFINEGNLVIQDNYGYAPRKLFLSNAGAKGYIDYLAENKRFVINAGGNFNLNEEARSFNLQNGRGVIEQDIFLRAQSPLNDRILDKASGYTTFIKNLSTCPDAPGVVPTSEASTTIYTLTDGTYEYAVAPIGVEGLGAVTEVSIAHTGGDKRTKLVITKAGSGEVPLGYKVYRRLAASNDPRDYLLVNTITATNGDATFYDDGEYIPGTTYGFLINWDSDQTLCFGQLADVMKLPYGIRADKKEYLLRLYGVLLGFNTNQIVVFKNVGT